MARLFQRWDMFAVIGKTSGGWPEPEGTTASGRGDGSRFAADLSLDSGSSPGPARARRPVPQSTPPEVSGSISRCLDGAPSGGTVDAKHPKTGCLAVKVILRSASPGR